LGASVTSKIVIASAKATLKAKEMAAPECHESQGENYSDKRGSGKIDFSVILNAVKDLNLAEIRDYSLSLKMWRRHPRRRRNRRGRRFYIFIFRCDLKVMMVRNDNSEKRDFLGPRLPRAREILTFSLAGSNTILRTHRVRPLGALT
jgi:hypothetical protein